MTISLTPDDIENAIVHEQYHVFPGSTVTVCCLTLINGFNAIGHSGCIDPSNFNEAIGKQVARENAARTIWQLEGYLLKQRMHDGIVG